MSEQNLSTPTTEDELTKALNAAVTSGDQVEIDRLMAVELPEPKDEPQPEEVEEPEDAKPPVKEPEGDDVDTEDTSSDVVEDEKDEAAAGKPDAASKPADVVKESPEIEALKAEIHRLKSDAGRVPYMQRKMQELERELRDAKLSPRKPEQRSEAKPENDDVIPKSVQKRLAALKEIDPDLAETLEEMTRTLREEAMANSQQVAQTVTQEADARADEEFVAQQYQSLVAEVPWAPQAFQSPEWKQWKQTLSPARRAFAESMYADEVKIALAAFANDMQARAQQSGNQVPAATDSVSTSEGGDPNQTQGTTEASKVQQTRERKLNTSGTAPSSVAAKRNSVEIDEQKLFSEIYAQIQKDNHLIR